MVPHFFRSCRRSVQLITTAALWAVVGCSDASDRSPTGPMAADLVSQAALAVLDSLGITGDPVDFPHNLDIDWPDDPPAHFTDDDALVDGVQRAGGRVYIGFKEPEQPKLVETVAQRSGRRTARRGPLSAQTISSARRSLERAGVVIEKPYRMLRGVTAVATPEAALVLRGNPLVSFIEPIGVFQAAVHANGTTALMRRAQTTPANISKVRAPQAWPVTRGAGARVIVLDTGVDNGTQTHRDLPSLNSSTCLSTVPNEPNCDEVHPQAHGTGVAGVALARDNTVNVVGVAPSANLVSIRVCSAALRCEGDWIADGLLWGVATGGFDVVNMSLQGDYDAQVAVAVSTAWAMGDVMVAAAGNVANGFSGFVAYPARFSQVIAVSGTTIDDQFHLGSTWGPEVELSAPYEVQSLWFGTSDMPHAGTSFSSPAVAGVAALVRAKYPTWTPTQVRNHLQASVVDLGIRGRDQIFGYGRIDACLAVGACPPVLPLTVDIVGPTQVRAWEFCTWQAVASGGAGGYTYQWSGVLSGTGSSVSGNVSSSGTLAVVVTSGGDQTNDSQWITVSSSAPECVE